MAARKVLVVTHTGKSEAVEASKQVLAKLGARGIEVVQASADGSGAQPDVKGIELVVVLGGDGTILKAAEFARGASVPLLGVNLGHVGFLAESEREDLETTIEGIVAKRYVVEERTALEVRVKRGAKVIWTSWALNEVSVEKASRERMIEVAVEIDRHPLSTFGADGVVISTPTGSTAYAFSAGGPIVWPTIAALLVVPISAHALFARPLVVEENAKVAVELLERNTAEGIIWCDGRRSADLKPGDRVVVSSSKEPVLLARLKTAEFTSRLVRKFNLPVTGWRGPGEND